ncbi:38037_t:CDS:1, partial [Gigaspora margarita]
SYISANLNHPHSTRLNINELIKENKVLKNENDSLKSQILVLTEELDTYKNPGTCDLRLAFKYPVSCLLLAQNLQ